MGYIQLNCKKTLKCPFEAIFTPQNALNKKLTSFNFDLKRTFAA